ncbi:MAG: glycosyltransferase family 4 protein [Candidatus Aminicenantes bacterium]|nr:glycosyltransferase family 4 protein [Candidatus Aminicenantes bacterium]
MTKKAKGNVKEFLKKASLNRKKILLCTRPISPPWDEASKNIAWKIARHCRGPFEFHVLTAKNMPIVDTIEKHRRDVSKGQSSMDDREQRALIICEPIYTSSKFRWPQKIQLLNRLFLHRLNADIIHFLFTPRPITSFLIKTRLFFSKIKTIQTVTTVTMKREQNSIRLKKTLFADKIIVQSNHTYNKLNESGMNGTQVIYPGINLEKFRPASKDKKVMQRLGLEEKNFVVMFAGEYTKIRGIDNVLESFEIICSNKNLRCGPVRHNVNYKLIIACRIKNKADKKKKDQIQKKIENTNYGQNIIFIDRYRGMPKLYNISDVNLFTVNEMTKKIDIPFVIIEAMACAKSVIISDIPVLKEFIKNGRNGLVVQNNDPQKIAACIVRLAKNPTLKEKLGREALKYAQKNFDVKKNIPLYETVYKQLIQ